MRVNLLEFELLNEFKRLAQHCLHLANQVPDFIVLRNLFCVQVVKAVELLLMVVELLIALQVRIVLYEHIRNF